MAHLFVDLYDGVDSANPFHTLDDQNENNRTLFYDLNIVGAADKAARVVVRPGNEYAIGDHIRLRDEVRNSNTGTVSVDPDVTRDVNLNVVNFADKAAAVEIVRNPSPSGRFRLRVILFDRSGQRSPNLVLYDWEFVPNQRIADLNLFAFADKAAFIRVERGPGYRRGDRILLWDSLRAGSRTQSYGPGTWDLNRDGWADRAAAVEFDLQPPV
jgi:hypothetical protein